MFLKKNVSYKKIISVTKCNSDRRALRLLVTAVGNIESEALNRKYIKQKLESGLGRIWADVQQKVKVYLLSSDIGHFKYEEFIQVLSIVNRYAGEN